MTKFNYDDIVRVTENADARFRPGCRAWIVGVFETRLGSYFDSFPFGTVYTVEFEDGTSEEIHEENLEAEANVTPLPSPDK